MAPKTLLLQCQISWLLDQQFSNLLYIKCGWLYRPPSKRTVGNSWVLQVSGMTFSSSLMCRHQFWAAGFSGQRHIDDELLFLTLSVVHNAKRLDSSVKHNAKRFVFAGRTPSSCYASFFLGWSTWLARHKTIVVAGRTGFFLLLLWSIWETIHKTIVMIVLSSA